MPLTEIIGIWSRVGDVAYLGQKMVAGSGPRVAVPLALWKYQARAVLAAHRDPVPNERSCYNLYTSCAHCASGYYASVAIGRSYSVSISQLGRCCLKYCSM